ncbi:hypothetical protein DLJ48_06095 [Oenococcus sicerae]|uniref:Uncharacterized protein n=1 Tax=Oenococcus sicerae TaxID=2203724 RepID=A0AAJ1VN06_9LACO|nr:hypothetical protein [Oenococcus sicerae]MDN6899424.1 hypothetical protein [Oenococcus sicerae]QAS70124.1 hypothetical protein DLJ48_06095 [Oenococcus sicerae]VDK13694.1 hypothetical protein OAL24_00490 [Oenococcus sicerae]
MIDRMDKKQLKKHYVNSSDRTQLNPLAAKDKASLDSMNFLQNRNLYNAIVVFLKLKRPQ